MPKDSTKKQHSPRHHPYSPAHSPTQAQSSSKETTDILFFYKSETTGLDIWKDHITEMAAKVDHEGDVNELTFTGEIQQHKYSWFNDDDDDDDDDDDGK